jgi:hypothetical protein
VGDIFLDMCFFCVEYVLKVTPFVTLFVFALLVKYGCTQGSITCRYYQGLGTQYVPYHTIGDSQLCRLRFQVGETTTMCLLDDGDP